MSRPRIAWRRESVETLKDIAAGVLAIVIIPCAYLALMTLVTP